MDGYYLPKGVEFSYHGCGNQEPMPVTRKHPKGKKNFMGDIGDQYGFVDRYGKIVIPFQYDNAYPFSEGVAVVYMQNSHKVRFGDGGIVEHAGLINQAGDVLIPITEGLISIDEFKNGRANAEKIVNWQQLKKDSGLPMDRKTGVIDVYGNEIIPFKYGHIGSYQEGLATVSIDQADESLYGFIDYDGNEVIKPQFDYASNFQEGLAAVKNYGPELDDFDEFGEWVFKNNLGDRAGYIDRTGRLVIPMIYHEVGDFQSGKAEVYIYEDEHTKKRGVIDRNGKLISPFEYVNY